jgi:hypothetical protein
LFGSGVFLHCLYVDMLGAQSIFLASVTSDD